MSHSSRLSIPLLLIIFFALAVPLIARAVTEADVLPGAKYCPWYKGFWCQDANRANGFTGDGTMTLAQYQARNSASSPVAPAVAQNQGTTQSVPATAYQTSGRDYLVDDKAFYENAQACNAKKGWTCTDEEKKWFYDSRGLSITPSSSKEPTDNWNLQGVREPSDNLDLQGGTKAKVVPGTTAPVSTEPDPSVWVKDSTGAYFLKSDLESSVPAIKALTPLQKYQAQFNVDAEFERIGKSCGADDLGMGQERCMNYMIGLYRGGNPLSSDALKVQTYINSQSSAPQPSTGNDADCAAKYPNEGDYGRYLQCVTQGQSQTPSATDSAYVNPYGESSSNADFYTYMDSCDKKYGTNTTDANICKEPILREMGITEPMQYPAPVVDYSRSAPAEDIARFNSAQPCARRAGNGDCLDEPTGGLQCYSWIASWLPACENYKSTPTLVPTKEGGVSVTYEQFPAPVEERQAPVPRPYTREEEDALSRITVTAEDTRFTPDETTPGPATGWLKNTQDFFSGLFGGGASKSKATYEIYDLERAYPDIPMGANFEPDWTPVLIEQNIFAAPAAVEVDYGQTPPGWDEPYNDSQDEILLYTETIREEDYGGDGTYWQEDAATNASGDASNQPSMRGFGTYDIRKGNDPEQVTGLTSDQLQKISDHCADDVYFQGCVLNNIDTFKVTGELIPSIQPSEPLPGEFSNTMQSESFVKDANYVQENVINDIPIQQDEGTGWSIWNPSSWPIFQGTEASIKPLRQFSMAVPLSGEMFQQSLVASAFGAFLADPKK